MKSYLIAPICIILSVVLCCLLLSDNFTWKDNTVTSPSHDHNAETVQTTSLRRLQSPTNGHLIPHTHVHHFNHSAAHRRGAWTHFKEIDGLKNEEIVMFVMSSTIRGGYLLRERVIASARTWMRMFANVVVVIEDTFEIRYALRHCELVDYDLYTTFNCHNEPTYLLTRNCTNEYYNADGICCKVDDSINYLVNVRSDWFKTIKYMLHSDDDTYWRPDQVLRWLAAVDNSGANNYPLISNVQFGDDNNKGVWMIQNCEEIHTSGWYQPTMLNHVALQKMAVAAAEYGNRDVCRAFTISQDVGIGIFAWLFETNHIQMPGTNVNGDHLGVQAFTPLDIAVHYVKHMESDRCDGKADNGWSHFDRYNQEMVIGCGDIDRSVVGHDKLKRADMYDAWNYYRSNGQDVVLNKPGVNEFIESYVIVNTTTEKVNHIIAERYEIKQNSDGSYIIPTTGVELINSTIYQLKPDEVVTRRVIPRLMPMRGYSTTNHSKVNDITKIWKPFTLQDCQPPGVKQH